MTPRLRAHLRAGYGARASSQRWPRPAKKVFFCSVAKVSTWSYSIGCCRVARGPREISLTPREFDLLTFLAQHHDQTVTRQMIAREVWREPNRATPLDNVIDVHLAHLRRKVDDGETMKLIQTVRGVGFVLRAETDA